MTVLKWQDFEVSKNTQFLEIRANVTCFAKFYWVGLIQKILAILFFTVKNVKCFEQITLLPLFTCILFTSIFAVFYTHFEVIHKPRGQNFGYF